MVTKRYRLKFWTGTKSEGDDRRSQQFNSYRTWIEALDADHVASPIWLWDTFIPFIWRLLNIKVGVIWLFQPPEGIARSTKFKSGN